MMVYLLSFINSPINSPINSSIIHRASPCGIEYRPFRARVWKWAAFFFTGLHPVHANYRPFRALRRYHLNFWSPEGAIYISDGQRPSKKERELSSIKNIFENNKSKVKWANR